MQPFLDLGAATGTSAVVIPLVDLISPMAQTLIETGYTRTDYSNPTPFQLVPRVDPVKLVGDLVNDVPEGIRAALNPGLDPLPGWTDPTQSADTAKVPDNGEDSRVTVSPPEDANLAVVAEPDRKPSLRLRATPGPKEALSTAEDATTSGPQRPSSRKTLGVKAHPARDITKSLGKTVRKALGQDKSDDKEKSEPAA